MKKQYPRRLIDYTCNYCGKAFQRRRCGRPLQDKHYCSLSCSTAQKNKQRARDRVPQPWLGTYGYLNIIVDGKRLLHHRYVVEQHLGRKLERQETVHHINGNRTDNRIENLQVRIGKHGNGQVYRCADCGSHMVEVVPLPEHDNTDPRGHIIAYTEGGGAIT